MEKYKKFKLFVQNKDIILNRINREYNPDRVQLNLLMFIAEDILELIVDLFKEIDSTFTKESFFKEMSKSKNINIENTKDFVYYILNINVFFEEKIRDIISFSMRWSKTSFNFDRCYSIHYKFVKKVEKWEKLGEIRRNQDNKK